MNKRFLPCKEKEVFAIGQENSLADCKEKIKACFDCWKFSDCQAWQSLFDTLKNQQNCFASLRRLKNEF